MRSRQQFQKRGRPHGTGPTGTTARRGGKPHSKRRGANASDELLGMRLQKVLAAAGIGSRRQCEELIREGRVDVDGKTVTELGTRADPQKQTIRVDGQVVKRPKRLLYFAINKPVGILSTNNDPSGRPRVIDLAPTDQRLFTIGRLDKSSSGLILATNDGRLTDLLTHPRYGVEKTYSAEVAGQPSTEAIARLERGVHLAEGFAHAKRATVRRSHRHCTSLDIVLDEGRNREVRRLLAHIGHKVMKLKRVAIGPLRLGSLKPGESRPLTKDEVEELYKSAQQRHKRTKPLKASARGTAVKLKSDMTDAAEETLPIIDRSVPADSLETETNFMPPDDVFMPPMDEDAALDNMDESADSFTPIEEPDADEAAPVDLSPIGAGRSRNQAQRTVIGGDQRRGKSPGKQPGKKKGRSTQNFMRDKSDRERGGRAGGRKRKRR